MARFGLVTISSGFTAGLFASGSDLSRLLTLVTSIVEFLGAVMSMVVGLLAAGVMSTTVGVALTTWASEEAAVAGTASVAVALTAVGGCGVVVLATGCYAGACRAGVGVGGA